MRVLPTVTVLAIACAIATFGCANSSNQDPTPNTIQSSPAAVPLTTTEVIGRAIDTLTDAGSFWFILDHENGYTESLGGLQLTYVEGAITEEAMEIEAEASLGRIYIEVDAIIIGENTWLTNPLTGVWEPLPDEENPISYLRPIEAIKGVLEGLSDPRYLEAPRSGENYSITSPIEALALKPLVGEVDPEGSGIADIVVNAETFELESAHIKGTMQTNDTEDTIRVVDLSRFGETFVIEPPMIDPPQ